MKNLGNVETFSLLKTWNPVFLRRKYWPSPQLTPFSPTLAFKNVKDGLKKMHFKSSFLPKDWCKKFLGFREKRGHIPYTAHLEGVAVSLFEMFTMFYFLYKQNRFFLSCSIKASWALAGWRRSRRRRKNGTGPG